MTPTNGETYDPTWRKISTTPTAQLSSQERSAQADAMFAQVGELTKQVTALRDDAKLCRVLSRDAHARLGMLDKELASVKSYALMSTHPDSSMLTLWQRLRWLLTGR